MFPYPQRIRWAYVAQRAASACWLACSAYLAPEVYQIDVQLRAQLCWYELLKDGMRLCSISAPVKPPKALCNAQYVRIDRKSAPAKGKQ